VVRAAYLDLTGQPVSGAEPAAGRSFMAESYDPLTAISYWRCGELGLRDWLSAARGVDETAWFASDDMRPFELMCVRMGWRMVSRPAGRLAGAARASRRAPADSASTGQAAGLDQPAALRMGPGRAQRRSRLAARRTRYQQASRTSATRGDH